jgi:hypothetical protein
MNLNQPLKKLRLFAASPSDVATERAKLETVVGVLKPLADHIGLSVEVVDWRKDYPWRSRKAPIESIKFCLCFKTTPLTLRNKIKNYGYNEYKF